MKKFNIWINENKNEEVNNQVSNNMVKTTSQAAKAIRDDKKNLGPMAFQSLQQIYGLLKNLAESNPQKLMYIIRIIDRELKNDPNAKGLMTGARRIINKLK